MTTNASSSAPMTPEPEIAALRAEVERWAAVANKEDECRQMWQGEAERAKADLARVTAERDALQHDVILMNTERMSMGFSLACAESAAETAERQRDEAVEALEKASIGLHPNEQRMHDIRAALTKLRGGT